MVAAVTPSLAMRARMPPTSWISARSTGTSAAPAAQAMATSEIQASKAGEDSSSTRSLACRPSAAAAP